MSITPALPGKNEERILCCLCGKLISPNPAGMCVECLKEQYDATEGLSKEEILCFCRECERYLQPPKYWFKCDLESKELLQFCLKRIKGLSKVKLIDAKFLWTEPHSRKVKVQITIQKEVFNDVVVQQDHVVSYEVQNLQCPQCKVSYTNYDWVAAVQLRQKVDHKRTFLFLEQMILKHGLHHSTISIKEYGDGLDFFFNARGDAQKFVHFLKSATPLKVTEAKRLIAHDDHNNTFAYKYTFSCEIPPICRDDLVCLPKKVHAYMGNIGPVVYTTKISNHLHFLDPITFKTGEIEPGYYWHNEFSSFMNTKNLAEFIILDVEPNFSKTFKNFVYGEVQACRPEEMGDDNAIRYGITHMGNVLKSGDKVMAYDLNASNFNDFNMERLQTNSKAKIPTLIVVKKIFKKKKRNWKLRQMTKEQVVFKKKNNKDLQDKDQDYEQFLQELEEDKEMRSKINLYKAKNVEDEAVEKFKQEKLKKAGEKKPKEGEEAAAEESSSEDEEEEGPGVEDSELLEDEGEAPTAQQKAAKAIAEAGVEGADGEEEEGEDAVEEDFGEGEGEDEAEEEGEGKEDEE